MTWQEAIKQSEKGTATRKQKSDNGEFDETYVKYKEGGIYKLVAKDKKVNFTLSKSIHGERLEELNQLTDWSPS